MTDTEGKKDSLHALLKAAGCELDSWQSDLYVKDTPAAREIIVEYEAAGGLTNKSTFRSDTDGKNWIELPFHNQPWWNARTTSMEEAPVATGMSL